MSVYIHECTHKHCERYFICKSYKDAEKIMNYEDDLSYSDKAAKIFEHLLLENQLPSRVQKILLLG